MKKLLLAMGLSLAAPLALAQDTGSKDDDKNSATPATPAIPATPASPALGEPEVDGPTTNDEGDTSGSARSGRQSIGATGNPNTKSAKTRSRADFGVLDVNGDNKISQDELKANTELSSRFSEADGNRDGSLTRGEFSRLEAGPTGNGKKQDDKEGSDRTDKDDELNRRLPGE